MLARCSVLPHILSDYLRNTSRSKVMYEVLPPNSPARHPGLTSMATFDRL